MTTGNDPAQPIPTDQPIPPVAETAPAAADPNAPPAVPDAVAEAAARMQADPDLIELSEAIKAVKVEEAAKIAPAGTELVEGKPDDPLKPVVAQPEPKPAGQRPAVPMIPKPRLDEALEGKSKAEQHAAYWRGVAEARGQPQAQPGQQQPTQNAPPKPEDKLATIHAAQDELAAKFDDGNITYADMKKQERALTDQEQAIREEILVAKVKPADPPKANEGGDKLYLDRLTVDLETMHPWTGVFDQVGTDADWAYLSGKAMENLAARGIDPKNGSIGTYEFRKEIAVLADQFGPSLVGARATAAGIALPNGQPPSQGQQQQQQQKPLSAEAQARAAKLTLQQGAPPNLSAMRGSNEDPAAPTDSRVESLSDDEIAALPATVRNKFLGITASG